MVLDAVEVGGRRVPEAPVVRQATGDVADVDLPLVVLTESGHGEEVLDVFEVLVVDLPDLQLLQEDVGERDAPGVELQTSDVADFVAVVELVDEHIDHRDSAAEVDVPGGPGHRHGLQIALVPHGLHELDEAAAVLAVRGEIDIGEIPLAEPLELGVQVDVVREVVVQRQRPHDAHHDALLLRGLRDPLPLLEEDLGLGVLVERDVLRQDELSHVFLSPPSTSGVVMIPHQTPLTRR